MDKENLSSGSYRHVLKYMGVFGSVQGLSLVIGLVRNKFIATLLGPSGMGLITLFNTIISFVSQSTNLGLSLSSVRYLSGRLENDSQEEIKHFVKVIRGWALLTALTGFLFCIMLAPLFNRLSFTWGNHTLHYLFLAPAVAMMAITGCETAILRGIHKLKELAMIQVASAFLILLLTTPLFYILSFKAIVPVISLTTFITMTVTIRYSLRYFPLQWRGTLGILRDGIGMVKLGVSLVLAGIMGSGAEMLIRWLINREGSLEVVGLYNSVYMMIITYAGIIFTSIENDYYPRLSAISTDNKAIRKVANRQIEVTLLMVFPMAVTLIQLMPIVVPLLFSLKFNTTIPVVQVATFTMLLRGITLSLNYITIAKGHSLVYLLLECTYDIMYVVIVYWFFKYWGLWGTGLALSVLYAIELIIIYLYTRTRYGFIFSARAILIFVIGMTACVATYISTLYSHGWLYWSIGIIIIIASTTFSLITAKKLCVKFPF